MVLTLQRDQNPSIGYPKSDDRGEILSDSQSMDQLSLQRTLSTNVVMTGNPI